MIFTHLCRPGRRAGTHTPQSTERARLHSPSKTGVNALMSGPCFRRDDPEYLKGSRDA
jgi:hypothetical protein